MKTTKDERDGLRYMAGMVTESLLMPPGAILDLLDDADELDRLREGLPEFIAYARKFYSSCEGEFTTSNREREEMQAEWDAHVLALLEPTQPDKGDAP